MTIAKNKMVFLTYDLRLDGPDGRLINSVTEEKPLAFLHGMGMMPPVFETQLEGMEQGKTFDIQLSCQDAYGEIDEQAIVDLPKNLFIIDGQFDEEIVKVGNTVPMMTTGGRPLNGIVLGLTDEAVTMDFNHPLAGEDLHFSGKILEVRDATEEEIAAMEGGCGCGKGCGCSDNEGHSHHGEGGCGCGCGNEGHSHDHGETCGCESERHSHGGCSH